MGGGGVSGTSDMPSFMITIKFKVMSPVRISDDFQLCFMANKWENTYRLNPPLRPLFALSTTPIIQWGEGLNFTVNIFEKFGQVVKYK